MDPDARASCLRAILLVARSAHLCATELGRLTDPRSVEDRGVGTGVLSDRYKESAGSAARMVERAERYYREMRAGHESHERAIRVVNAALVEAQICVRQLQTGLIEPNDLAMQAEKIERAVVRASGSPS